MRDSPLSQGSTGFWAGHDVPLPQTDAALFRRICFEAARAARSRVGALIPAGNASFHSATIRGTEDGPHYVLCHAHLPVVAFAGTPPVPGQPLSGFENPPTWAQAFEAAGLQPLGIRELSTPMADMDISELAEAEIAQIRYWRPAVLSELLFNWWD